MQKEVVMDYSELRSKIKEKVFTIENLSNLTGIPRSTLSRKLSTGKPLNTSQVIAVRDALGIKSRDTDRFFFTQNVS